MRKRKRFAAKTRLTARNVRDTLNALIVAFNEAVDASWHLPKVSSPRELYAVRDKLSEWEGAASAQLGAQGRVASVNEGVEPIPTEVVKALVELATNAWRARRKLVNSDTGEPHPEMKGAVRHIDAQLREFSELGIEIRDMQGRAFDTGMALKVVSFEPQAGLSKEEIIETIRPTIAWNGKLIQMGEVIVGTPQ